MSTNIDIRRIQLVELEMLKRVKEICEENNITYYLSDGTVLGAVRHKGFIPWDDDIDVAILRPDYQRFIKIAQAKLTYPYSILKPGDEGYLFGFVKIIDKRVKVKTSTRQNSEEWYLWLDVFPLDSMPGNKIVFMLRKYHLLYRRLLYLYSCFDDMVNIKRKNRPLHERIFIEFAKIIHPERLLDTERQIYKLNKALTKYPFEKGSQIISFHGAYKFRSLMGKDVYGKSALLTFEDGLYPVPEKYEEYLSRLYGDYLQLPPEEQRNQHELEVIKYEVE